MATVSVTDMPLSKNIKSHYCLQVNLIIIVLTGV